MVSFTFCSSVVVIFVAILVFPLYRMDFFKTFSGTLGKKCSLISAPGLVGVEDIDDNPREKKLFLSSDDRYWTKNIIETNNLSTSFTGKNGAIYSLYYGEGTDLIPTEMKLKNYKPLDFHPHGIGFIPAVGNLLPRLFVVNHRRDGDFVEIFDVNDRSNTLSHITSISHPSFRNINDITPVDHVTFFVSNIFSEPLNVGPRIFLEVLGFIPGGSVVYCHGMDGDCKIILENIFLSNGVFIQDTSLVIVVSREVHKYHFHKHNTSLSLIDIYPTSNTNCDNLAQDRDGTLYTACHPSSWLVFHHIQDSKNSAPTQIMKKEKNLKIFKEIMISTGDDFSAATVAVPDNQGHIYLGSVWEEGIMRCEM